MGSSRRGGRAGGNLDGTLFASLAVYALYKHRQAHLSLQWTLLSNEGLAATNRELEKDNPASRASGAAFT